MAYTQEQLRNAQGDYEDRGFFTKIQEWMNKPSDSGQQGPRTQQSAPTQGQGVMAGVGMAGDMIKQSDTSGGQDQGSAVLGGVASGAATGAAFGPWGAVIGGAIGGVSGLLSSNAASKAAKKAEKEQKRQEFNQMQDVKAAQAIAHGSNIADIMGRTAQNMRISSTR